MRLSRLIPALSVWFASTPALAAEGAQRTLDGLSQTGSRAGFGSQPPSFTVFLANIINAILSLSGILLLGILVYAGIQYLTSGGDQEKVKNSKGMIVSAVIGIVIVAVSYALTTFLFDQLQGAISV